MTGPPQHARDRIPDRGALQAFIDDHSPPFRVRYRKGGEVIEEGFESVDTSRGGRLAELHYADGRYITVDVASEVERVEVSE